MRLDGSAAAPRALFVAMGGAANALSGGSRAAQYMLLEQAITEVRTPQALLPNDTRLLSPANVLRVIRGDFSRGGSVRGADRAGRTSDPSSEAQRAKA